MARRATKIADERKNGQPVLVLDAGNSLTGDHEPALTTKGASSIEAMNLMGYDAIALGPDDLKLGPSVLRSRLEEAKFPVLSSNAVNRKTGDLIAKPYAVQVLNGYRVVIVGLSGPGDTDEIVVRDPLDSVKTAVAEAKAQADAIVVLSTAGASVNQLIADTVPGVTAIVEGGQGVAGTAWSSTKTRTPIFHADQGSSGHAGRFLGIARLTLNPSGSLAQHEWKQFSLGPEVSDDATLADWVLTKASG